MASTGISSYELPSATDIDSASSLNLGLTGTGASSSSSSALTGSSLDSLLSSGDSSESSLDAILGDLGSEGDSSSSSSSSSGGILSDLGSIGTDLGDLFTSALTSPLGELGTYAGLTAYGLSQAQSAQEETTSEANQIITASQPYLTAGNSLLSQYEAGTLPSWAQSTVNFDTTEGQDIINSGQALQTIANQNLAQYSSGQLKPSDQLALDQSTAAQTQQVMSALGAGGTVDSSVAAAYQQQIQQNAQITQQNILNSYYTTGDNAYNSWLTSTTEGANLINQGGQFAQTTFNQMLTGALGLSDIGMQGLTTAIGLEIQSDTALSQEVSTLMSNIASAYAYTLAGPGNAKSGSSSSTVASAAGSLLGSAGSLVNDLLGSNLGSEVASDSSSADSTVSSTLGDVSSVGDVGDTGLESQLASEGFSTAGGAATAAANLGDYSDAADLATESALGSAAASDGTAASVAASNDAALAASDGGAAGASAGLGAGSDLSDVGTALGVVGSAASLYNTVENWQSGATGSDALSGAESGASIGATVGNIVPGIGTVVGAVAGAVIGGVVGAVSSAFGGGKTDPETLNWDNIAGQLASNPSMANSLTAAQSYQLLAGVMDAKNNTAGHSEPIEQVFGREGEGNLMTQMTTQINSAITSGQISSSATPAQIYQQVVEPWLASKNASIPANQMTSNGQPEGQALPYVIERLIGLWQAGNLTSSTQVGVSGQTISGLPSYGA